MANLGILYLLNSVVISAGFIHGLVKRRIYGIFWLSLLAFHLASLLDFPQLVQNHSLHTLVYGQILMLLANFVFFLMVTSLDYLVIEQRGNVRRKKFERDQEKDAIKYIYFVMFLVVVSFLIRLREGASILYLSWEELRESSGILDSFANMLGFISAPVLWMIMKKRKYLLMGIFGLLFFLQIQISGSRALLLVFGCSILIDLMFSSYSYMKRIGILASFGILIFLSHTFLRLIRGLSLAGLIIALNTGMQNISIGSIDFSGGESKIYSYYYYMLESDADEYPYRSAVTLKRLGLLYLPTTLFPNIKPVDMTYQLWKDWVNEDRVLSGLFQYIEIPGSIHPTIWGDAYMNAGRTGIVLYPLFFGFGIILIEYFLTGLSTLGFHAIAPIVGVGYMMIGRGNVVIGSGYIGYIIPMILLMMFLLRINVFNGRNMKSGSKIK
jgi:hypothetical protein